MENYRYDYDMIRYGYMRTIDMDNYIYIWNMVSLQTPHVRKEIAEKKHTSSARKFYNYRSKAQQSWRSAVGMDRWNPRSIRSRPSPIRHWIKPALTGKSPMFDKQNPHRSNFSEGKNGFQFANSHRLPIEKASGFNKVTSNHWVLSWFYYGFTMILLCCYGFTVILL